MSDIYRDGFSNIASMYINQYQDRPEEAIKLFCNTNSPLEIMMTVYGFLVSDKSVKKIEDLDYETKLKLWNQAKTSCPTADQRKAIKLSKCIWLLHSILEK